MAAIPSIWLWVGIVICIVNSGLFAGLNLAIFSLSPLRLQIEFDGGNADAKRVLELRKNSNQVLSTIIWGNVSINVLLTLLSDSVLAGVSAFLFSAVAITILGEIVPQAYFSRNALRMTVLFVPFLEFYRFVLYPLAKPTALVLDLWLGTEGIVYLRERDIRSLIARSAASGGDVSKIEALGARNFLDLDDVLVIDEGELIDVRSIISLPIENRKCILPKFDRAPSDPFLRQLDASGKKWVIVTDLKGEPVFVLDSHHFLRDALFNELEAPTAYWHRPIIVRNGQTRLGDVIGRMTVTPQRPDDDVVHHDLILVWGDQKRIITGSDLLGRLLRDITTVEVNPAAAAAKPKSRIETAAS
ncbi:MAG TPA: DUF21 domain-containing protein [Xanthobacteraceae bacterium]|nr:DUF21 domain-containing protein [Xanthobacteraceae bacterium]